MRTSRSSTAAEPPDATPGSLASGLRPSDSGVPRSSSADRTNCSREALSGSRVHFSASLGATSSRYARYGDTTAAASPARKSRPISQLNPVAAMIAPDHSDGPHSDPGGASDSSAMYTKAYVPPITAVSEADGRPGRRALHAIHASAARPVSTGTGSRYSRPLVINTKIPFSVKTKVSEPGRGLNALLSSNPVPARIADWARSAAIPMFSPSHTRVGSENS